MSGSDRGSRGSHSGSSGGSSGGAFGHEDCDIVELTTLNSTVPDVLAKLQAGNILSLELQMPGSPPLLALYQGNIAGSITTAMLDEIIDCINRDVEFEALVLTVSGGTCNVKVRPKSR